jgi:hypothetical protein
MIVRVKSLDIDWNMQKEPSYYKEFIANWDEQAMLY